MFKFAFSKRIIFNDLFKLFVITIVLKYTHLNPVFILIQVEKGDMDYLSSFLSLNLEKIAFFI